MKNCKKNVSILLELVFGELRKKCCVQIMYKFVGNPRKQYLRGTLQPTARYIPKKSALPQMFFENILKPL